MSFSQWATVPFSLTIDAELEKFINDYGFRYSKHNHADVFCSAARLMDYIWTSSRYGLQVRICEPGRLQRGIDFSVIRKKLIPEFPLKTIHMLLTPALYSDLRTFCQAFNLGDLSTTALVALHTLRLVDAARINGARFFMVDPHALRGREFAPPDEPPP